MPQNYAPRISLPWNDLSGVASIWQEYCSQIIIYEHDADEEVSRTHCHFLMIDCTVKEERLKRLSKLPGKGNEFWSWIHKQFPNPDVTFIKYMSKGTLRPVFQKNFSDQIVEEQRGLWIDYKNQPSKKLAKPEKTVKDDKGTHWDLIMKMWNEIKENPRIVQHVLDREGAMVPTIINHTLAFDVMCNHLNANKVRTSRNELERFYVTLMRQDTYGMKSLKSSVLNNIFRDNEY